GPAACIPLDPTNGDSLCTALGQGNQCRFCNGPFDPITNLNAYPIGYNTHGSAQLELYDGQRVSVITGVALNNTTPLYLVGTSGYAASDFRDLPAEGSNTFDLADLGPVDNLGLPFGAGLGAGGTFANGVTLPIGESCCASGGSVAWPPAALGEPVPGTS